MKNQRLDQVNSILDEISNTIDDRVAKKLNIDNCKRIIQRLNAFSSNCQECDQHFTDLENHISHLKSKINYLDDDDIKNHTKKIGSISTHLQNQHGLISKGYYLSLFMSIGTSIGLVLGLSLFDNIALGLPLGMCIGIAIGAGLDADAEKKGLTL